MVWKGTECQIVEENVFYTWNTLSKQRLKSNSYIEISYILDLTEVKAGRLNILCPTGSLNDVLRKHYLHSYCLR